MDFIITFVLLIIAIWIGVPWVMGWLDADYGDTPLDNSPVKRRKDD